MPAISATAPAKTILLGEHAVVYGFPAIAVPLHSIRTKAIVQPGLTVKRSIVRFQQDHEKKELYVDQLDDADLLKNLFALVETRLNIKLPPFILTIDSSIPIAAGLGSSAALAVATIRALSTFVGIKLTDEQVNEIAFLSEKFQHVTPSGVDNCVVAFGKPVFFSQGNPVETLRATKDFHIVLADSGERALTKDVLQSVHSSANVDPERFQALFQKIGKIVYQARSSFDYGDAENLGQLMTENHQILDEIGVSTPSLNRLVEQAIGQGAYGAKLCGGGRGGFMVALCSEDIQQLVEEKLAATSPQVISTVIKKGK